MKNVAKCYTWCQLQNPVNHRVFERKLRPKPLGREHVCLGVSHRMASSDGHHQRPIGALLASTHARCFRPRPQVRRDYLLSLSISISGGKETYKDSPSNGERIGNSPT
ncbi:hypothetical protein CDL12_15070 [Handroanthus impetiginosus]|uniref:Uncharacterized protein n=1 Tax=Handroanthus impetiginosus TaxID=429701 RepID=A0A2G9H473_9LAMI|nr:hypothetical protein CDL12_15070 [Handroanthus impetiginosus]